jgi:hypothetical protein
MDSHDIVGEQAQRHSDYAQFQSGAAEPYESQIELFARGFKDEAHLRRVLADLLIKMGHSAVRITHGPGEKGKDIVFYDEGPMGERRLFACVVKARPISGRADDHKNGAPTLVDQLQTVVNQVNSAFSEPFADGKARDEWVDSVYVISPHACSTATIESVKSRLQRSGQIRFVCGSDLMELFVRHYQEFLWFESSILVSYLSTLRKGLEENYALASLILGNPYLGDSPSSWTELYVGPQFHRELRPFRLLDGYMLDLGILSGPKRKADVKRFTAMVQRINTLLEAYPFWGNDETSAVGIIRKCRNIATEIEKLWAAREREYFALSSKRRKGGSRHSGKDEGLPLSVEDVIMPLQPSAELVSEAASARDSVTVALDGLRSQISVATRFASKKHQNALDTLRDPEFLTYCQVGEIATMAPLAFELDEISQDL